MKRNTSIGRAGSITARPSSKKRRQQEKKFAKEQKRKLTAGSTIPKNSVDGEEEKEEKEEEEEDDDIVEDVSVKENLANEEDMDVEEDIDVDEDIDAEKELNVNEEAELAENIDVNEEVDVSEDIAVFKEVEVDEEADGNEDLEVDEEDDVNEDIDVEEKVGAEISEAADIDVQTTDRPELDCSNVVAENETYNHDDPNDSDHLVSQLSEHSTAESVFGSDVNESGNQILEYTPEVSFNVVDEAEHETVQKQVSDNETETPNQNDKNYNETSAAIETSEHQESSFNISPEPIESSHMDSEFDLVEVIEEPMDIEENELAVPEDSNDLPEKLNENSSVPEKETNKPMFAIKSVFLKKTEQQDNNIESDADYDMLESSYKPSTEGNVTKTTTSVKDEPTILLDHERYVLKKTNDIQKSQFSSNIVYSKLDSESDICVNILANGNITFFNISNKHKLWMEKNLLSLLNVSIEDLAFLQVFFSPNAKSLDSLKKIDEITTNPGILIMNSRKGTIWHFDNLKYSLKMDLFTSVRNDNLITNGDDTDLKYLPNIQCLLVKNHKRQLVLFNLLTNEISTLKHSSDSNMKSLFGSLFKTGRSARKDVVDFEIENQITQQTISVLFDSDFAFFNIRKFLTANGNHYEFEQIPFNDTFKLPNFITQSVLGDVGAVIILKFKKLYENKNAKYYCFLASTGFNNLLLITAEITTVFNTLNVFNTNYFQKQPFDNKDLISLETAFIEGENHYTSFIVSGQNINIVQIPLFESGNTENVVFRDIITFQQHNEVKSCLVYEFEDNIKTCCLSFQTAESPQSSFYQLHMKNIETRSIKNVDSIDYFLDFHLRSYLMKPVSENGLSNIISDSWFNKDFDLLLSALKTTTSKVCLSENLNTVEKESMVENMLLSLHSNFPYWGDCIVPEKLKPVISTIMNYLSLLKSFNSINLFSNLTGEFVELDVHDSTNNFLNMEMVLKNTFENINKRIYASLETSNFDISGYVFRVLKLFDSTLYDPVVENVENHYRNNLFKDIVGAADCSELMFSQNLATVFSDFILLLAKLDIDSTVAPRLYMLLKFLYYQNSKLNNSVFAENHIFWIESLLKVSTSQSNTKSHLDLYDDVINMLEYYNDIVGVFKVLDYLLTKRIVNYDNYSKLFSVQDGSRYELVERFVDFYINKANNQKLQVFFDIVMHLNDSGLTSEIYKLLLKKNQSGHYADILWPFETLINKNYGSAFNTLARKIKNDADDESNKIGGENQSERFKNFELSMAFLCSQLAPAQTGSDEKMYLEDAFQKYSSAQ